MASKDLIDTLIAEAGGEGDAGLVAAAWAIQQRAAARGQTVDEVIRSGFDGYSNPGSGAIRAQQDPALRARVERIVNGVAKGTIPNPVPGADHFLSGNVMPSWANSMQPVATIGGHRFYASGNVPKSAYGGPIPPMDIPNPPGSAVGTQLSVTPPRIAPTPAMPSPASAALRQMTSPTGGNSALQSALDQMATRERNRVTPASVEDRVTARNTAPSSSLFSGDPGTRANGPVVASIPSRGSLFSDDPGTPSAGSVVARIPSNGGPATSIRPSVPVSRPSNITSARNEQAIQRTVAPRPSSPATVQAPATAARMDSVGSMPSFASMQATLGPRLQQSQVAGLYGNIYDGTLRARQEMTATAASPSIPNNNFGVATLQNTVSPVTGLRTTAPATLPISGPLPRIRPSIQPTMAQTPIARPMAVTSTPMARPLVQTIAPQAQPLTIRVQGANTIPYPQPKPQSITSQQRVQNGRDAVSQSGDTSSGNQREAAERRASGDKWRASR